MGVTNLVPEFIERIIAPVAGESTRISI